MLHLLAFVVAGAAAGTLGALVGLGGGIIIVPVLSLFMGVPIHQAVAASLVAVVATSSVAAIGYTRDEISNLRLGFSVFLFSISPLQKSSISSLFETPSKSSGKRG